jgi:hypothetical protein
MQSASDTASIHAAITATLVKSSVKAHDTVVVVLRQASILSLQGEKVSAAQLT